MTLKILLLNKYKMDLHYDIIDSVPKYVFSYDFDTKTIVVDVNVFNNDMQGDIFILHQYMEIDIETISPATQKSFNEIIYNTFTITGSTDSTYFNTYRNKVLLHTFKLTVNTNQDDIIYDNFEYYINNNKQLYHNITFQKYDSHFQFEGLCMGNMDPILNALYAGNWYISHSHNMDNGAYILSMITTSINPEYFVAELSINSNSYLMVFNVDSLIDIKYIRTSYNYLYSKISTRHDGEFFIMTEDTHEHSNIIEKYNASTVWECGNTSTYFFTHNMNVYFNVNPRVETSEDTKDFVNHNVKCVDLPGKIYKIHIGQPKHSTDPVADMLKIFNNFENKLNFPVLISENNSLILMGFVCSEDPYKEYNENVKNISIISDTDFITLSILKKINTVEWLTYNIFIYHDMIKGKLCFYILINCGQSTLRKIIKNLDKYFDDVKQRAQSKIIDSDIEIFSNENLTNMSGKELTYIRNISQAYYNVKDLWYYIVCDKNHSIPHNREKITSDMETTIAGYYLNPNDWADND